jgi:predicted aldo/keto reductase-like oxidoreductase
MCRERDIGVMVMMPPAGGLLMPRKAFPDEQATGAVTARDVLRSILRNPNVTCVLPGTASVEEAKENAMAGHAPMEVPPHAQAGLTARVTELRNSHCSRCGTCESLCSKDLPVSWLFRAHDIAHHEAERFETWDDVEYFRLHPDLEAACLSCTEVTCMCPYGIEIPKALIGVHDDMAALLSAKLIPPPEDRAPLLGNHEFGARLVRLDIPREMTPGRTADRKSVV